MQKALQQLIEISNKVGSDPSLVIGPFGNTSVKTKDGEYMYIKASGTEMRRMDTKNGYRRLNIEKTLAILDEPDLEELTEEKRQPRIANALLAACEDDCPDHIRPSIESCFHALLDKFVIHLHPESVLAFVCSKNGKAALEKIFETEKVLPLWIPYVGLGYPLAKKIQKLSQTYQKQNNAAPCVLFLQNHGLLISAPTASDALQLVKSVVSICCSKFQKPVHAKVKAPDPTAVHRAALAVRAAVYETTKRFATVSHYLDKDVVAFMTRNDTAKLLTPAAVASDEWYFCNGSPLWITEPDKKKIVNQLKKRTAKDLPVPKGFLIPDIGLFTVSYDQSPQLLKQFFTAFFNIRTNAADLGGFAVLSEIDRRHIPLPSPVVSGTLANRIAVVTGAGSGLGRAIAVGLARAGANIAIVDVDSRAADDAQNQIKEQNPHIQTLFLNCDVTDQQSVKESYAKLLDTFGGLDILVNAAGIAPAYPLVELPVEKFRRTLDINLTGYLLMAKHAARIMVAQDIGGSIVNISSKSGLEPSKNNTPYNATKAGEVHMARGWALELGPNNIRVNSVCPGNVFEGSKIWNPDYIKECAKKYGIKPEEVIPHYVSKTALNREIKGQDVADTVVFLCSDNARCITGQTIVTDAGQVFSR